MVQVSILGYAMSLLCVGLAHEVYLLGFLLFCFGVFWNLCDISFNTQGIEVERLYGKTIMATFHGGWSLGACTGALIGFVMILTGTSPVWHYMLIAAIILIIVLAGRKYLQETTLPICEHPKPSLETTDKAIPSVISKAGNTPFTIRFSRIIRAHRRECYVRLECCLF